MEKDILLPKLVSLLNQESNIIYFLKLSFFSDELSSISLTQLKDYNHFYDEDGLKKIYPDTISHFYQKGNNKTDFDNYDEANSVFNSIINDLKKYS